MKKIIVLFLIMSATLILVGCNTLEDNQKLIQSYIDLFEGAESYSLVDHESTYKYKDGEVQIYYDDVLFQINDLETNKFYINYLNRQWVYEPYINIDMLEFKEVFESIDVKDSEIYVSDYEIYLESYDATLIFNIDNDDTTYDFVIDSKLMYAEFIIQDINETELETINQNDIVTNAIYDFIIDVNYQALASEFYTYEDDIDWKDYIRVAIASKYANYYHLPFEYYNYYINYTKDSGIQEAVLTIGGVTKIFNLFFYDPNDEMIAILDKKGDIFTIIPIDDIDQVDFAHFDNLYDISSWEIYTEDKSEGNDIHDITTNAYITPVLEPKPFDELMDYYLNHEFYQAETVNGIFTVEGVNVYPYVSDKPYIYSNLEDRVSYELDEIDGSWMEVPYQVTVDQLFELLAYIETIDLEIISIDDYNFSYNLDLEDQNNDIISINITINDPLGYVYIDVEYRDYLYKQNMYYTLYFNDDFFNTQTYDKPEDGDVLIPLDLKFIRLNGNLSYDDGIIYDEYTTFDIYFTSNTYITLYADNPLLTYTYDEALNQIIVHYTYDGEIYDGTIDLKE